MACEIDPARRCLWCGKPAEVRCDYPVPYRTSGLCGLPACREHSRAVGPNQDWCNAHPDPAPEQPPLLDAQP